MTRKRTGNQKWFRQFTNAYVTAMLWSTSGDDDEHLDATHGPENISLAASKQIVRDCRKFWDAHSDLLEDANIEERTRAKLECEAWEYAGHDFWLTRSGSGVGFWDGDWLGEAGEALDKAARSFGNVDPYVGDDGLIYLG